MNEVLFEEDIDLPKKEVLDENFDKFISRVKKYTPTQGDIFGVFIEPTTPQNVVKSLIKNLEIFSRQTKVHFIVIPNNMEISDVTDKLTEELKQKINELNTTASS